MISYDSALFGTARRFRRALLATGLLLAALGGLLALVLFGTLPPELWRAGSSAPRSLAVLAASLFIAAAGLLSAGLVAAGRVQLLPRPARPVPLPEAVGRWRRFVPELRLPALAPGWLAGWPQVLAAGICGCAALALLAAGWRLDETPGWPAQARQLLGGALVLLGFLFLVLERVYAGTPRDTLPDAPQLARLLLLPVLASVGVGCAELLSGAGFTWAPLIARTIALFIGLAAAELVLRAAVFLFIPFAPPESQLAAADSSIAGLLRVRRLSFGAMNSAVRQQFGIDLARSWALAFLRRAILPVTAGLGLLAWCASGLTALGIDQRAVYERLGSPVAVLGPGLHLHLPWPFGIVRRVELGILHEIPVSLAPELRAQLAADSRTGAEDAAPATADRLWDRPHPAEGTYLVANASDGKQSFQIVAADLRILYRTGLTDADAIRTAYAVADPESLVRTAAGRLLSRALARHTIAEMLGQGRDAFAEGFRTSLQSELDDLSSGIEIIAVIVGAIHPPVAAAAAYHNVQAAEILARSTVGVRRGEAFRTRKLAEQTALADRNRAAADAAELVGQARTASILFQGDREANRDSGTAFLLERWLDRLGAISKSGLLVVDHRLSDETPPTIDLRGLGAVGTQLSFLEPGQSAVSAKSEIFARKILMTGIGQNMDEIWTMLDSKQGIDLMKLQYHADMVSIMLQSLPYLFPASTNQWSDNPQRDAGRDTDASPDIWTHFSDFAAKAAAASKFAFDASRARNESDFRDIARNLQDACDACHLAYRKGEQQP